MAFNGAGVFNRVHNWQQDAANGINIMADRMDAEDSGFAAGLSICLTRDGQSVMQAPLDMAGFKILRLGSPTLNTDAVNLSYFKDNPIWTIDGSNILTFDTQPVFGAGFKVGGTLPQIIFEESDQVDPAGRWRFTAEGDNFLLQKAVTAGTFSGATNAMLFTGATSILTLGTGWTIGAVTFSSNITFDSAGPIINFIESDQVDPAGRWRMICSNDQIYFDHAITAGTATGSQIPLLMSGAKKRVEFRTPWTTFYSDEMVSAMGGNHLRMKPADTTAGIAVMLRTDAGSFYVMMTASADADGSFNTLRPLAINKTTGLLSSNNGQSFAGGTTYGAAVGDDPQDLSKHITLHSNGYGFNVTTAPSRLNIVTGSSLAAIDFYATTTYLGGISEAEWVIGSNAPTLTFRENDSAGPLGRYRITVNGGNLTWSRAVTGNFATSANFMIVSNTQTLFYDHSTGVSAAMLRIFGPRVSVFGNGLQLPDSASAADPVLCFGDVTTGIGNRNSSGQMDVITGGVERQIWSSINVYFPTLPTTASAGNCFLDPGSSPINRMNRSTSSARYKKDIKPMDLAAAEHIVRNIEAVTFRSLAENDDPDQVFLGFTAEQAEQVDARLITRDADGRPDWVQYQTLVVPLCALVKRLLERVEQLENA